jgi:hypothetical protein
MNVAELEGHDCEGDRAQEVFVVGFPFWRAVFELAEPDPT